MTKKHHDNNLRVINDHHQEQQLRLEKNLKKWKILLTFLCLLCIVFVYLLASNHHKDGEHDGVSRSVLDICMKAYGPVRSTFSSKKTKQSTATDRAEISAQSTEKISKRTRGEKNGNGNENSDTVVTEQTPPISHTSSKSQQIEQEREREQGQQEPEEITFIPRPKTRNLLFKAATLFLILSYVSLVLFHLSSPKRAIFLTLFTVSWYHISWGFLLFFKQYLNDVTCNIHPNSVSGHYHYFVFSMLTLPFLFTFLSHEQQKDSLMNGKKKSRSGSSTSGSSGGIVVTIDKFCLRREMAFFTIYGILFLLSILCMIETYSDGYHSLRQIIYGSTLAVVSHVLFMYVLTHIYLPNDKIRSAGILGLLFVVMIICNSVTGTVLKVLLINVVGLGLTALAAHFI